MVGLALMAAQLLLAGAPDAGAPPARETVVSVPTGNAEVDACLRELEAGQAGTARERRGLAGKCAVAFKAPSCAQAVRRAARADPHRWPAEARNACCDSYADRLRTAPRAHGSELCDDDHALPDAAAARQAWLAFAQAVFELDWALPAAASLPSAQRFAESFVPDFVELPEDVRNPPLALGVLVHRESSSGKLVAIVSDPRAPPPGRRVELGAPKEARRWEALLGVVEAYEARVRLELQPGPEVSPTELSQLEAALRGRGYGVTVR